MRISFCFTEHLSRFVKGSIARNADRICDPIPHCCLSGLGLLLGFFLCMPALGQENGQEQAQVEEIVVIASRVPLPLSRVAAAVTVVGEESIDGHGDFALRDILQQAVGMGGDSNGGAGAVSSLRIRGEEGYRTLVVLDGLRLRDPTTPQVMPRFEHLLAGGIGRVEILRGPQGLSYGADAGGVIRISSRRAFAGSAYDSNDRAVDENIVASLDSQVGSRGTQQLSATLAARGGADEAFDLSIAAEGFRTDGYNARLSDTQLQDHDGYGNDSVHLRAGLGLSDSWRGEIVHRRTEAEAEYDGCGFPTVHRCQAFYELRGSRLAVEYSGQGSSHSLAYSRSDTQREDHAAGIFSFAAEGAVSRWEYLGNARAMPGLDLVFGIDYAREESDTGSGKDSRSNRGYYVETLGELNKRFFLSAGLRRDENDDYGAHYSRRIGAVYWLRPGGLLSTGGLVKPESRGQIKLKASYGTGLRSPSLYEAGYNFGPFARPPAQGTGLTEETSRGLEFGVEYHREALGPSEVRGSEASAYFELLFFRQQIDDAIVFASDFSGYVQDTGRSTSHGMEVTVRYPLGWGWLLNANFTRNITERPDGSQRLRRPEKLFNLGAAYRSPADRFRVNIHYRGSRDAVDEAGGISLPIDDFEVLDVRLAYRLDSRLEVYGRVENALDAEYREVTDYRAPRRAVYLGLKLHL